MDMSLLSEFRRRKIGYERPSEISTRRSSCCYAAQLSSAYVPLKTWATGEGSYSGIGEEERG